MSAYVICDKCGQRHSTLVRHKCFVPEAQEDRPEFDNPPPGDGGEETGGKGNDKNQDNQQDGDGEGNQQEGDGDDQQQGQGQGQGEQEEEIPPVVVVVTVLKYAVLTAESLSKKLDGAIRVDLTEDGLLITGTANRAGKTFTDLFPWGEFEKRATLDGEMHVRELIEGVRDRIEVSNDED